MNKITKILTYAVLPLAIVALVVLNVRSVMKPLNFEKEKTAREQVAIQRLKDLRTIQVAYKSANGQYAESMDEVIKYYKNGKIKIMMQIGSEDDSAAVANTKALKKKNPGIKPEQMLEYYKQGQNLVFAIESDIPVKDTLCHRDDFCIDSIAYIPYSGGRKVIMETAVKTVSGVKVPLFEACMPYKALLKGMDEQLRINLDAERKDTDRYPGLKVGSITAPNNNAGNWE